MQEFYTPLLPKRVAFVQQRMSETVVLRSVSNSTPSSRHSQYDQKRYSSARYSLDIQRDAQRRLSVSPTPPTDYGNQPSLFVVFEKKAGLIRLADSAVGEVELFDENPNGSISPRRAKTSFEAIVMSRDSKGSWMPPSLEELPTSSGMPDGGSSQCYYEPDTQRVYLLSRGKQTHILPFPLPTPLNSTPPLSVLTWLSVPQEVCHRVCYPPDEPPFLQVVGLGEFGVEVQEVPLPLSSPSKGKSRERRILRGQLDVGGDAGYLCHSGLWHKRQQALMRSDTIMSMDSMSTFRPQKKDSEMGFYGWCRRGLNDWRVFWIGGMEQDVDPMDE